MAHLIMRRGPEPGTIYRLNTPVISIGRGNRNTIIIQDNEVSRDHVRLVLTDAGYEIEDLNSSNGTFINGQDITGNKWLLQNPCIIELGDSITLEFRPGEPGTDDLRSTRTINTFDDSQFTQSYLVYLGRDEHSQPAVYPLNGMNITVGRSTACNIVIIEPELSREHFRLSLVGRTYSITDLGSTNGTMLNNEILEDTRPLNNGDIIQIGRSLRFQFTNQPERFTSDIITNRLVDETKIGPKAKRKTSESETIWMHPSKMTTEAFTNVSLAENILVSYARQDWDRVVAPLMNVLSEMGMPVWADQEWQEGTPLWEVITQQARMECPVMIIVLSRAALNSDNVMKNWRHFHNRDKPIFLLISEPIDRMPAEAGNLPKIQFNPAVPEMAFRQLAAEINRLYGRQ
jgi:pSer/pThr/pTyr-binding forkhead associated (FHA) protein